MTTVSMGIVNKTYGNIGSHQPKIHAIPFFLSFMKIILCICETFCFYIVCCVCCDMSSLNRNGSERKRGMFHWIWYWIIMKIGFRWMESSFIVRWLILNLTLGWRMIPKRQQTYSFHMRGKKKPTRNKHLLVVDLDVQFHFNIYTRQMNTKWMESIQWKIHALQFLNIQFITFH